MDYVPAAQGGNSTGLLSLVPSCIRVQRGRRKSTGLKKFVVEGSKQADFTAAEQACSVKAFFGENYCLVLLHQDYTLTSLKNA